MATVREYFDTDSKLMSAHAEWELRDAKGDRQGAVIAKIIEDYDGNAKYWSFFIPSTVPLDSVTAILASPETAGCNLSAAGSSFRVEMGFADYSERATSATLLFTKRIFFYIDAHLTPDIRRQIAEVGLERGFFVLVRDQEYARKRSEYETPLAFISHDSRDKDTLVRELAMELSKLFCRVWYDEYSLQVGDSLRACIEKGLREARKCIVILSPNFFSNKGWGRAEFDSIFTREIVEKQNVILPVWHNVGVQEVYQYSPRLADRVGLSSTLGVPELARRLCSAIKQNNS